MNNFTNADVEEFRQIGGTKGGIKREQTKGCFISGLNNNLEPLSRKFVGVLKSGKKFVNLMKLEKAWVFS